MKLSGLFLVFFSICAYAGSADGNLTLEDAMARKAQISEVSYKIHLTFTKGSGKFSGDTQIKVKLSDLQKDLWIDSDIEEMISVSLNGKELKTFRQEPGKLVIPRKLLSPENLIQFKYNTSFTNRAHGLRKMTDPIDREEYIYGDFEPNYAHTVFPCFDQPDIKARMTLSVSAPPEWKVIHNALVSKETITGKNKISLFQETNPISTYLLFVGAGPYAEWKSQHNKIPMFIHSRKSMAKYMDAENIFSIAKKGMDFYSEYFKTPYPFSKYGHVYVPELVVNALETPGATLFHEHYLFTGPVPMARQEARKSNILHEMAHMWFGNLVTPKWWNDLWLKEGFATYISTLAYEQSYQSDYAKIEFFEVKNWGYWSDQFSTTHPIETNVPDVRTAKGIFDGITYAKGAAAIKQLHFYSGEENLKKAIIRYFEKYAWSNADRDDFIGALEEASGKDLNRWVQSWLSTSGTNEVSLDYKCSENKISSATIFQTKNLSGAVLPHKAKFALYKKSGKELKLTHVIDAVYENEKNETKAFKGLACPDFILPNKDDLDYALFNLDRKSLKLAGLALTALPDSLSRYQLWISLMQMVRKGKLSPVTFMNLAIDALRVEKDDTIIGLLVARHSIIRDLRRIYLIYLTPAERKSLAPKFEQVIWDRILKDKDEGTQISFFDFYTSIVTTPEGVNKLYSLLINNAPPEGITLDYGKRFRIIRNLAWNGHPESFRLIHEGMKHDPSSYGQCMGLVSKAACPERDLKRSIFLKFFERDTLNFCQIQETAYWIHHPDRPDLTQDLVNEYFEKITTLDWTKFDDRVVPIFGNFFPGTLCSQDLLDLSRKKLSQAKNLTSLARKSWVESNDDLESCVKIRSRD